MNRWLNQFALTVAAIFLAMLALLIVFEIRLSQLEREAIREPEIIE